MYQYIVQLSQSTNIYIDVQSPQIDTKNTNGSQQDTQIWTERQTDKHIYTTD